MLVFMKRVFSILEKFISEKGIYKIRAITVCDDGYRLETGYPIAEYDDVASLQKNMWRDSES